MNDHPIIERLLARAAGWEEVMIDPHRSLASQLEARAMRDRLLAEAVKVEQGRSLHGEGGDGEDREHALVTFKRYAGRTEVPS